MRKTILISDDVPRSTRLARTLGVFQACSVHDLYGDTFPVDVPEVIVSDVKALTSEAIRRLRNLLSRIRGAGVPYLCLLHDDGPRTRIQADLLGASAMLSASATTRMLLDALDGSWDGAEPIPATVRRQADTACQFLRDAFVPGCAITPDIIDVGTEIVANAVRQSGIRDWVRVVRRFDDATHQHCLLVAGLSCAFAGTLGFGATDSHKLAKASLLHDVGKIHVPTSILNKPGRLDEAEMTVMRTHPEQGHAMLVGRGFEDTMLAVVRSHHEMLDGSGYPDGLKGWEIPDLVRLVTVCDIYGALIEHRPYRASMPSPQAYRILEEMADKLDVGLVGAFRPVAVALYELTSAKGSASIEPKHR